MVMRGVDVDSSVTNAGGWGMLIARRVVCIWKARDAPENLCLLLSFAVNLALLLVYLKGKQRTAGSGQWLGPSALLPGARFNSWSGELRSLKLHLQAKKKKEKRKQQL